MRVMVQAPYAALLCKVRMCRMRRQQFIQCRCSRIEVAVLQIRKHIAQLASQSNESGHLRLRKGGNGGRIDGEDAGQRGHGCPRGDRGIALAARRELVHQLGRDQQTGVFVTI